VERVYTYTRQQPAIFRRTPTVFEVRVRVDEDKREVRWIQDSYDSDGDLGRNIEIYTDCKIFNKTNWKCSSALPDKVWIEMREGKLFQHYWTEDRVFGSRYSLRTNL